MTKEETKEAIKVMQAYVDGEDIEFGHRFCESWTGLTALPISWNWTDCRYRIVKPKPVELKVGMELVLDNPLSTLKSTVLALYGGYCFYSRNGEADMERYSYMIRHYVTRVNDVIHELISPEPF